MKKHDLEPLNKVVMEESQHKVIERLIPESQLRQIVEELVKQTLAQILCTNTTPTQQMREWYDTDPAYCLLGLDSAKQLRKMITNGILRVGKRGQQEEFEVRDLRSPESKLARYQFHIEKCEARLSLPPQMRKGRKKVA